jgi:hypothetical protein
VLRAAALWRSQSSQSASNCFCFILSKVNVTPLWKWINLQNVLTWGQFGQKYGQHAWKTAREKVKLPKNGEGMHKTPFLVPKVNTF